MKNNKGKKNLLQVAGLMQKHKRKAPNSKQRENDLMNLTIVMTE